MPKALYRLFSWSLNALIILMMLAVILILAYGFLGRYSIPLVNDHNAFIFKKASELSGYNVNAKSLEGSLDHYYPVFRFKDLSISAVKSSSSTSLLSSDSTSSSTDSSSTDSSPTETDSASQAIAPALLIHDLEVTIDPLASIRSGQLRMRAIKVNGLHANIEQQSDGQWRLQGFPKTKGSNLDTLKDFFRHLETLDVEQTWLQFTRLNGGRSLVGPAQIALNREYDFRRVEAWLKPAFNEAEPTGTKPKIDELDKSATDIPQTDQVNTDQVNDGIYLLFESYGDVFELDELSLHGYVKTGRSDISKHLNSLAPDFILNHLQANAQLWLEWEKPTGLLVQGSIKKAEVGLASVKKSITIKHASGDFLLSYQKDRWQAWLPLLSLKHLSRSVELHQVYIDTEEKQRDNLYVDVEHIKVGDITQILGGSKLFSPSLRRLILGINAKGNLKQIEAIIPLKRSQLSHLSLNAKATDIRSKAWKGIPGLTPVNGELSATLMSGSFAFKDQKVDLDFAPIYKKLMPFKTLSGAVNWNILADRFTVGASHLSGQGLFGQADLAFHLNLPKKKGDFDPNIVLSAGLKKGNLEHRNLLIPQVLSPELHKWLDTSILKGSVEQGRFLYRGKLVKKTDERPTIQLLAKAKGVDLDYQNPWPKVTNANGSLAIHNGDVNVKVNSAVMKSLRLTKTNIALVKSSEGVSNQITLDGKFYGSAQNALRFLKETPIRSQLGSFIEDWHASGKVSGVVSVHVPLNDTAPPVDVAAEITLKGAQLALPSQNLEFNDLGGEVSYTTASGVQSDNLTGLFWDEPFSANIRNDLSLSPSLLFIQADALVNAKRVQDWTDLSLLTFAKGTAPVRAVFTVEGEKTDLNLTSSLKGIEVNLPKPLFKPADREREFNFSLSLSDQQRPWLMRYGTEVKARFHRVDGELRRGQVILGRGEFKDSIDPVLMVTGSLDSFDLNEWISAQEQLKKAELEMAANKSSLEKEESESLPIQIRQVNLKEVTAFEQKLRDMNASAFQFDDRWRVQIENDIAAGAIEVFNDDKPIAIALDRLQLEPLIKQNEIAEQTGDADNPSPLGYTPFNITIADMKNGDEKYGRWSFQLRPIEGGVELQNLQAQFKGLNIGGEGQKKDGNKGATVRWKEDAKGEQVTEFEGFLLCDDMGYVLKQWGYEPIITSKKCRYDADVNWPGTPVDFDMETISGLTQFRLEEGNFASIPDGATSALKIVGILNLSRILKRIQLDFSDLSGDGLAYDWLEGKVKANDGVMLLDKPLVIKGSSSEMRLSGIVDVPAENMDAEMVVTLPIGSNLPWIAALAVNLPAAAGVFVISKMLKKQVDKLSSAVYSLKGPWDDPEVKFERLFDDKGKNVSLDDLVGAKINQPNTGQSDQSGNNETVSDKVDTPEDNTFDEMWDGEDE